MNLKQIATMLALVAGAICASAPVQAAVLTLKPSVAIALVGDAFTVEVEVSDLGAGAAVGVYDLDVSFDESLVTLNGVVFGAGLDVLGLGSIQFDTPGVGKVNLFELSLDLADDLLALQPDSFVLATMTFTAASGGSGAFGLSVNAIGDASGDPLVASVQEASVSIVQGSSVPEPGSVALVLSAVAIAFLATPGTKRTEGRRRRTS